MSLGTASHGHFNGLHSELNISVLHLAQRHLVSSFISVFFWLHGTNIVLTEDKLSDSCYVFDISGYKSRKFKAR